MGARRSAATGADHESWRSMRMPSRWRKRGRDERRDKPSMPSMNAKQGKTKATLSSHALRLPCLIDKALSCYVHVVDLDIFRSCVATYLSQSQSNESTGGGEQVHSAFSTETHVADELTTFAVSERPALMSTKIFTCLSFSLISAQYPSSTNRSI